MSQAEISAIGAMLKSALAPDVVNAVGRAQGQSKRLRVVTPFRLVVTLVGAMASGTVRSIAELLREFNYQHGTTTAYKAFYNRLSHRGFTAFMREVVNCGADAVGAAHAGPQAR